MNYLIAALIFSVILNIFLFWYMAKILSKLLYTSDNLGDLYIALRMYEEYTTSLYQMEMFYGEPVIQELIAKTRLMTEEVKRFEDIYGLTTDIEALEEELEELNDNKYDESTGKEETA